jgi:3-phenylpropionate/trans-cinnamate dioxygenase ferredoxin subunit
MPAPELFQWQKIAESIHELDFASNDIAVVETAGKKICIGRYQSKLYAFAYKCPHASGIMADGYIDALGNIVCPVHRYKFNLQNGRNTSGEGYYLKRWAAEEREDGVYVNLS